MSEICWQGGELGLLRHFATGQVRTDSVGAWPAFDVCIFGVCFWYTLALKYLMFAHCNPSSTSSCNIGHQSNLQWVHISVWYTRWGDRCVLYPPILCQNHWQLKWTRLVSFYVSIGWGCWHTHSNHEATNVCAIICLQGCQPGRDPIPRIPSQGKWNNWGHVFVSPTA